MIDARTGEPIAKAAVRVPALDVQAESAGDGTFVLADIPEGDVELVVSTVGYGLARRVVTVGGTTDAVEIALGQEALKRTEEVVVEAAPFDPVDRAAPGAQVLGGVELRNLASVLTDDPLRSVQSLPGVATGDDFYASFASRGLGFSALGFYLDGVPMNAPFHTILDSNDSYSLTLLNGDVVDAVTFLAGGAPARYGDRIGSALDVTTRDGGTEGFAGRASLGASGAYATLEGPVGKDRRTTWLVSGRKSYLDYVLKQVDAESGIVLGYYDVTGKLTHHLSPSQTLSLTGLHGSSTWQAGDDERDAGSVASADAGSDLGTLRWRWLPSARGSLDVSAFATLEDGHNLSREGAERYVSRSTQWGTRVDGVYVAGQHRLEAGGLFRDLHTETRERQWLSRTGEYIVTDDYVGDGRRWGAYVQDTWAVARRLSLTAGGRADRFDATDEDVWLPRASATFALTSSTKAIAAYGEYAQFPTFPQLLGGGGDPALRAERSRQVSFALEQRLGERSRVRVEAYDHDASNVIFARDSEWRLVNGRSTPPSPAARLGNVLGGRSRGVELLVQRRSANGVSGWLAYAYGRARAEDESGGRRFDSDFDQTHTLTAYAGIRASRTLNLSVKYRYGSGFPVAGFFRREGERFFLSDVRNTARADAYSRLDLRVNKTWLFRSSKLTVFGEVLNVLDHDNRRYTGLDELDPRTGLVFIDNETLFPRLPSIGLTFDF